MSTLLALFETSGIIDTITSVLGTILYPLFSIIFVLVDAIQDVFFKFAGIGGTMSFDGTSITGEGLGGETNTGIIYYLMQYPLIKNMLISIMLLALFLIIIFTTMAFIKNAYSAKPKGWKDIIGNAIKGLANFVFLPVCCLLGVWLGNILLQAINGATSSGGATSMGRKLFIASAYNANVFRCDEDANGVTYTDIIDLAENTYIIGTSDTFASKNTIEKHTVGNTDEIDSNYYGYYAEIVDRIYAQTNANIHWYGTGLFTNGVGYFYSLWQINYLVLIVGGIFMLYVLGSLAFAMVRRLFFILVLFIISPGVCAMYPLDDGKAVGSWKNEFIKQVLSAYGAVAGLNIFFSLIPLIDKISLYESGGFGINDIVQIFILVSGLMVVKELMSLITGFVGGEDAYGKGSSLMKGAAKEVGGRAGKFATKTAGAFARAKAVQDTTGHGFFRSLGGSVVGGLTGTGKNALKTLTGGALDIDAIQKEVKEARKDGLEHPNKRQERQIERYNERRSNRAFKTDREEAENLIQSVGNRALTNDEMAGVLSGITDKESKRRVAQMFAAHNNRNNMRRGVNKGTTTVEKVLEAEDKVLQEESRRQDAFGVQTDFTSASGERLTQLGNVANFERSNNRGGTISFDRSTGKVTGITKTTDSELERLRMAAEGPGAGADDISKYTKALEDNRIIKEYADLVKTKSENDKKIKQAALNFASGLEKLAENYSGNDKTALKQTANDVKAVVNNSSSTPHDIENAVRKARTTLSAEIQNILNTGHR